MKAYYFLLCGLILGCTGGNNTSLAETQWRLVQTQDTSGTITGVTYPHGKVGNGYWLSFKQDTIYGSDNCNSFSGQYTVDKTTMKISDLVSTLRACSETIDMLPALTKVKSYERSGSKLRLFSDTKLSVLVFEQVK